MKHPGGPDGGHHAFGAAAQHAEQFHRRHVPADQCSQLHLIFVEQAGNRAAFPDQVDHPLLHRPVVAAQHGGAAGLEKIDVAVAVHIPQVGAVGFGHGQGKRVVESQVVLHAAGDMGLGGLGHGPGTGAAGLEMIENRFHPVPAKRAHGLADQVPHPLHDPGDIRPLGNGSSACGHWTLLDDRGVDFKLF